jgi:hypothetical protein
MEKEAEKYLLIVFNQLGIVAVDVQKLLNVLNAKAAEK